MPQASRANAIALLANWIRLQKEKFPVLSRWLFDLSLWQFRDLIIYLRSVLYHGAYEISMLLSYFIYFIEVSAQSASVAHVHKGPDCAIDWRLENRKVGRLCFDSFSLSMPWSVQT